MARPQHLLALACTSLLACGDDGAPAEVDAGSSGDAALASDASGSGDAAQPLGWVDFAVSGCQSGDGTEASPCLGPSPLVLRFTALAPATIDNQLWSFGDGSEADPAVSPEHRFEVPGSYDITLNVEGPGGTAGVTRLAAVVVIPAPLGSECSASEHCASGECACALQGSCPPALAEGLCTLSCASHAACGGNRCVNLDPAGLADQDWRRTTCLPACAPGGGECGPGKTCQALLGVDGELTYACFVPGLLAELGASCRNFDGVLDDSTCASGLCLDAGDRGMCSSSCETLSCPTGSACATIAAGDPNPICLAECALFACDGDAQLSCQDPGGDFSIAGNAEPAGYCAPTP